MSQIQVDKINKNKALGWKDRLWIICISMSELENTGKLLWSMDRCPVLAGSSPRGRGRPAADRWARCGTCRWRGRPAAPPPRRTCGPIRSEHPVTWAATANHLSAAGLNLKPGCTTMAATLYVSLGNRSWASYDSATGIRGIIYWISVVISSIKKTLLQN